jgi:phosphoadenosine phosphosulfate reductase
MDDLFTGKSKEEIAIERIKTFCPPEGYYVAFSGGKDSVIILDLVKRSGVKFDAHYNITGIDPPELFRFIRDNFPEVQRHKPEITIISQTLLASINFVSTGTGKIASTQWIWWAN